MKKITKSEQETIGFGIEIAGLLKGGDIILLEGELGSGKTTLTKGLAKGLGITNDILSPTFSLMNIYKCNFGDIGEFIHIDTYRLKNENELIEIGIEDYLGKTGKVCVIEWPNKIVSLLEGKTIKKIILKHQDGKREIEFLP